MSGYRPEPGVVNDAVNSSTCNQLCPVNKLSEKYRHIFSNYEYFNKIQTKAIDTILYTDKSIVVSSPTGSGKTVVFELAIISFLETFEKFPSDFQNSKIIYVAPIKTLCSERCKDWTNKFLHHGLNCIEISGDTEHSDDIGVINSHQLIITTPEKWDSLTRRYKEFKYLLYSIKLFLIDEVHLINDGNRGATLETIVSRMKIISKIPNLNCFNLRFMAVSATASNIEDIAKWLSIDQHHAADYFKSNENDRPVKLQKIVLGYNNKVGGFKFDLDLTYKLKPLITQYSNGRPTLIFCSTRKSVELTCSYLIKDVNIQLSDDMQIHINTVSKEINNNKLKEMLKLRIGCHHAGMSLLERNAVENLFRMGCLLILVATSTLAMGVNLPAHLVIIKTTEYYNFNSYKEYNEFHIMQMIGRAGRPQFDTSATAIIMTKNSMKERYEKILVSNQIVESHLHKHLIEHLNANIVLGEVHDVTTMMNWIRSTFLYVRACRSPQNYGMSRYLNVDEVESWLQNLCLTEIKALANSGLINFFDESSKITSNLEGEIMAKYLISFATMKSFTQLKGTESLCDILQILTSAKEFEYIKLRRVEKGKLNILNKNKSQDSDIIRFPIKEGIQTREAKVNCLLQATLGTLKILDTSLAQDANTIIFTSKRLTKALKDITFRGTKFKVAQSACVLAKCVSTRLWEQSKFVSKLIPKVGPVLAGDFVLNGKTTLKSIRDTDPREIERFLNRNPPFGNHVHNFILQIPRYKIYTYFDNCFDSICLKITLIDHNNISNTIQYHSASILVGDSENRLLKIKSIYNKEFLDQGGTLCMTVSKLKTYWSNKPDYTVTVCLISDQWVGTDIEIKLQPSEGEVHITKESMSEENIILESPLKTAAPCTRPLKKKISKVFEPKQKKCKENTQTNIKQFLHNISFQDPKNIRMPCAEMDKDTTKCWADKSNVATQEITGEIIETQVNSQNSGQISEHFKFDNGKKNYFYYHKLLNDDVFNNLFVADDNSFDISKACDSMEEKRILKENGTQTDDVFKDLYVSDDNSFDISKTCDSIVEKRILKENETQTDDVFQDLYVSDDNLFDFSKACNLMVEKRILKENETQTDDVFKDLYVYDDNSFDISKACDLMVEKRISKENENQSKNMQNLFQREIIEPIKLQYSRDNFLHGSLENKESTIDHTVIAKNTTVKYVDKLKNTSSVDVNHRGSGSDHFKADLLENKENNDVFRLENRLKKRLPFDVLQQDLSNRQTQKTPTLQLSDELDILKKNIRNKKKNTDDDRSKRIKSVFFSSTPKRSPHNPHEQPKKKSAESFSLLQQIATRLIEATGHGPAENRSKIGGKTGPKAAATAADGGPEKEDRSAVPPAKSRRLDVGKRTLDKYFNATKSRFVPVAASPAAGEPLYSPYFSNHGECSKNDSKNLLLSNRIGRKHKQPLHHFHAAAEFQYFGDGV